MKLFLCGDVMTGRGIDQIMRHPADPVLYEPYARSALDYVRLAERCSGEIPRYVPFDYIWGDALSEVEQRKPDLRIINLETSITGDGLPEHKGINYRMHPGNIECLDAAKIDCCVLANNHVADWGLESLKDTLLALQTAGIASAGAGLDADAAIRPAVLQAGSGKRLIVFAFACISAGVPEHWAAGRNLPGVNLLPDLAEASLMNVAYAIDAWRWPGDIILVSLHWGASWGYDVFREHQDFARNLVDRANVDIVHGHSSHHPLAIEVHAERPIFYGCGDFINDYEGIGGHQAFRPDLTLAYLIDVDDETHHLRRLEMIPFRLQRFQLTRATYEEALWLCETLDRECRHFGGHVRFDEQNALFWSPLPDTDSS